MKRKRWRLAGLVLTLMVSMSMHSFGEPVTGAEEQDDLFTDTDMRRGMLAVRCDTFQGFSGIVELKLKGQENEKEITLLMTKESGYLVNQELLPQVYQIEELTADSGGRTFDCKIEDYQIAIENDGITMFRITIEPGSLYLVPYEEEQEMDVKAATTAQLNDLEANSAVGDLKQSEERSKSDSHVDRNVILCFALFGMAASFTGIVLAGRRHREEE